VDAGRSGEHPSKPETYMDSKVGKTSRGRAPDSLHTFADILLVSHKILPPLTHNKSDP